MDGLIASFERIKGFWRHGKTNYCKDNIQFSGILHITIEVLNFSSLAGTGRNIFLSLPRSFK